MVGEYRRWEERVGKRVGEGRGAEERGGQGKVVERSR